MKRGLLPYMASLLAAYSFGAYCISHPDWHRTAALRLVAYGARRRRH